MLNYGQIGCVYNMHCAGKLLMSDWRVNDYMVDPRRVVVAGGGVAHYFSMAVGHSVKPISVLLNK